MKKIIKLALATSSLIIFSTVLTSVSNAAPNKSLEKINCKNNLFLIDHWLIFSLMLTPRMITISGIYCTCIQLLRHRRLILFD